VTEPLDAAAAVVGDRWALLVCDALLRGPARFADLQAQLPEVASNVLTRRLRDLEAAGVVTSERYSERPPRHRYALSPLGRGLAPALAALARWGEQLPEPGAAEGETAAPGAAALDAVDGFGAEAGDDEVRWA
jgi:DNA-binding HxlR family transcriptional regulator